MQDDHDRPRDDHDAEASADDINKAHDAEDEQAASDDPAEISDTDETDPAQALAEAIDTGDPDVAFVDLSEAINTRQLNRKKGRGKLPFFFDTQCTTILFIGYVLAWLTFVIAGVSELFAILAAFVSGFRHFGAEEFLVIFILGPIAVLNSFIWIIVLGRVGNLEKPVLVAKPVPAPPPPTREGRDPAGIDVADFPDVRHNDPADVAAELGGQTQGDSNG